MIKVPRTLGPSWSPILAVSHGECPGPGPAGEGQRGRATPHQRIFELWEVWKAGYTRELWSHGRAG